MTKDQPTNDTLNQNDKIQVVAVNTKFASLNKKDGTLEVIETSLIDQNNLDKLDRLFNWH